MRRLTTTGMGRSDAVASVALDRFVGAVGLTVFVAFAGAALPVRMLVIALAFAGVLLLGLLVLRKVRPDLMPSRPVPRPKQLAHGLLLSAGYQATTAALLLGSLAATGHTLSPLEVMAAFGASQLAGAVPGPHGASPRDGALVVSLVAFGVPWVAAAAAVTLKAALAWLPALLLGGTSLLLTRRALRHATPVPTAA
jgi:hypothetical protein